MVKDPLTGRLVDSRYEIVDLVARGGMATVYRAYDRRLDRVVGLKLMHAHLADSPDFVARFRREARAARACRIREWSRFTTRAVSRASPT